MSEREIEGRTFSEWKRQADAVCESIAGVSLDDLPDKPYWDYWSSGYSPRDAAMEVLEEEGWDFDA